MSGDYIFDEYVRDKEYVVCGICALVRNGLIIANKEHLDLFTAFPEIDGLDAFAVRYIYNPDIDYEYEVSPSFTNPLILLPSKERALVEYLICGKYCDEGILIEALKSYLMWFRNLEKLYRTAAHFGLRREVLDYWIQEAEADEEV